MTNHPDQAGPRDDFFDVEVVVVGAGPVGLTLANTLAQYGVKCMLLERSERVGILPKMDLSNPRTMEIFGRLGFAGKIRAAGWPLDARFDVLVGPSLVEPAYTVLPYPSITEMQATIAATNDGSMPREPYERISQYHLEELLRAELEAQPTARALFGHDVVAFEDKGDRVSLRAVRANGTELRINCRYLVGCDGGNSRVRSLLGVQLDGKTAVARNFMIFFRAPDLLEKTGLRAFRHFYLAGKRQATLVAQDDLKRWSLHVKIPFDLDVALLDPLQEIRESLGIDLQPEILYSGAWTPHLLVADRYSKGRVFLAGDAVHQYIPTGGFGMNTGVSEADNLAWKLAATLQGWGGPGLLESYHDERQPVAVRNCRASEYATEGVKQWRQLYDPVVLERTELGRTQREKLVSAIDQYQRRSHEQHGIELGYRYVRSRVIAHEEGDGPDPDTPQYIPTAVPGARLPHAWVRPGESVHDLCGKKITLLVLSDVAEQAAKGFESAAKSRALPLKLLRIPSDQLRCVYGASLLLLRPDLHVVWRGEGIASAAEPTRLLDIATGY